MVIEMGMDFELNLEKALYYEYACPSCPPDGRA